MSMKVDLKNEIECINHRMTIEHNQLWGKPRQLSGDDWKETIITVEGSAPNGTWLPVFQVRVAATRDTDKMLDLILNLRNEYGINAGKTRISGCASFSVLLGDS